MYAEFYGFSALPFQLTPDAHFFYNSSGHSKAMAHLTYGLHQGEGFIIITGEVGAGKTTLVDHLISTLGGSSHAIAKIVTSQLKADDMLRIVAAGFGVFAEGLDKTSLLKRIENCVVGNLRIGKRSLLIVDEVQNVPVEALEELRMLSNITAGNVTPLQSILLGQPQFRSIIASPALEQLRQRVTASYHLGPMNSAETRAYIEHRLKTVGWKGDPDFSNDALLAIYSRTYGIPRRINTVCSRLLLLAFLEESHHIAKEMVNNVVEEMNNEIAPAAGEAPAAVAPASGDKETAAPVLAPELSGRIDALEKLVARQHEAIKRAVRHIVTLKRAVTRQQKEVQRTIRLVAAPPQSPAQ